MGKDRIKKELKWEFLVSELDNVKRKKGGDYINVEFHYHPPQPLNGVLHNDRETKSCSNTNLQENGHIFHSYIYIY